jgi:hypothetical protein
MPLNRTALAALAGLLLPALARGAVSAAPALDEPSVVALAIALALSPARNAAAPDAAPAPGEQVLEVDATVRARGVVFDAVPRVRLGGEPAMQGITWRIERVNLPARVEPGVVYQDVTVRLSLAGTPERIEALLREARRLSGGVTLETGDAAAPAPPAAAPAPAVALAPAGIAPPAHAPAAAPAAAPAPIAAERYAEDDDAATKLADALPPAADALRPGSADDAVAPAAEPAPPPRARDDLLSATRSPAGETVERILDPSGMIVERTIGPSGWVVDERVVANAQGLPLISQGRDEDGQILQIVRDASGTPVQLRMDAMGRFLDARVLSPTRPTAVPASGVAPPARAPSGT